MDGTYCSQGKSGGLGEARPIPVYVGENNKKDDDDFDLLEFRRLCELNEVLGPVALGDEWLGALAGLRRCLRAPARAGHREKSKTQRSKTEEDKSVWGTLIVDRRFKRQTNKQGGRGV